MAAGAGVGCANIWSVPNTPSQHAAVTPSAHARPPDDVRGRLAALETSPWSKGMVSASSAAPAAAAAAARGATAP